MKPYSLDLRGKIIDAFFNKEGSIRGLARRFKVSFRFVWGLIDRYRETGSMAPKPHGGGYPPTIKEENYEILRKIEEQNSDATLEELCDLFEKQCHSKPSKAGMHRTKIFGTLDTPKGLLEERSSKFKELKSQLANVNDPIKIHMRTIMESFETGLFVGSDELEIPGDRTMRTTNNYLFASSRVWMSRAAPISSAMITASAWAGMSLKGCFTHAGRRFADKPEFLEEKARWKKYGVTFYPNSQFGVGMLSYFMLADELEVDTYRLDPEGRPGELLRATISGSGSRFRVMSQGQGRESGTRVRLYLNR